MRAPAFIIYKRATDVRRWQPPWEADADHSEVSPQFIFHLEMLGLTFTDLLWFMIKYMIQIRDDAM